MDLEGLLNSLMVMTWLRLTLISLVVFVASMAFGQSYATEGSGTLTIGSRKHQIEKTTVDINGNKFRLVIWTTNDKRYDIVGQSSRDDNRYRLRADDGLGESHLTGFVNVNMKDWRTVRSIEGSGRFSGGTFDLSFQPTREGGGGGGDWSSSAGSLTIAGVKYRVNRAEYNPSGNSFRLILFVDNGQRYDLVGTRRTGRGGDELVIDDGLGEERVSGGGTVDVRNGRTSGNGRFRGGTFTFNTNFRGGGNSNRPEPGPTSNGKLRFDDRSRSIVRYEYNRDGNKFRLIMWTDNGDRFDILGSRSSSRNQDRLTVNDGLGKDRMDGSGTAVLRDGGLVNLVLSGRYRGGSFSVSINSR